MDLRIGVRPRGLPDTGHRRPRAAGVAVPACDRRLLCLYHASGQHQYACRARSVRQLAVHGHPGDAHAGWPGSPGARRRPQPQICLFAGRAVPYDARLSPRRRWRHSTHRGHHRPDGEVNQVDQHAWNDRPPGPSRRSRHYPAAYAPCTTCAARLLARTSAPERSHDDVHRAQRAPRHVDLRRSELQPAASMTDHRRTGCWVPRGWSSETDTCVGLVRPLWWRAAAESSNRDLRLYSKPRRLRESDREPLSGSTTCSSTTSRN
jgi:hypothetical protein